VSRIVLALCWIAVLGGACPGFAQEERPRPVWHYPDFGGVQDSSRYDSRKMVRVPLNFARSTSYTGAYFRDAWFDGEAYFKYAHFGGEVDFREARFGGEADFRYAHFGGEAYFREARFGGEALFWGARFDGEAYFWYTQFGGEVDDFRNAQFDGMANFANAQFDAQFGGETLFGRARFGGEAYFREARFGGKANFVNAQFDGMANFANAQFDSTAFFNGAQFDRTARFDGAHLRHASFSGTRFSAEPSFSGTAFTGVLRFGAHFDSGVDLRKADLKKLEYIYLDGISYPPGAFRVYWGDIDARENAPVIRVIEEDSVDPDGDVVYKALSVVYKHLRDNGYQPWRFLLIVFVLIVPFFAAVWRWKFFTIVRSIVHQEVSLRSLPDAPSDRLSQAWHVVYFSTAVLLGLRFKREWIIPHDEEGRRSRFTKLVTAEWAFGIGLYILFAVTVKGHRFSYIKGLLGF